MPPVLIETDVPEQAYRREALTVGARDYIVRPFDIREFLARVHNMLEVWQAHQIVKYQKDILEIKVQERTKELREAHDELQDSRLEVVWRLGRAAEYRDNETGLHIIRMSHYSRIIAEKVSSDKLWSDLIFNTAPMHDVGKIGIPDKIILKPGKLNDDEWTIMKKHCEYGAEIIGDHNSRVLQMAKEIALTHHEKWDGSGYPYGLSGNNIPITGRIIALADVFDALTSERPYKSAWSVDKAVDLIVDHAGRHFDPDLVMVFKDVLSDLLIYKNKYAESTVSK